MIYIYILSLLSFSMDMASFKDTDSTTYVEVYYSISYRSLKYIEEKGRYKASFSITINVKAQSGKDSLEYTFPRTSYITNLRDAKDRDLKAADLIPLTLPSNRDYSISLTMVDNNTGKKQIKIMFLYNRKWDKFCTSDIQLSHTMTSGKEGKFAKNGYRLIPYPERVFGTSRPIMDYYLEIYHFPKKRGKIFYQILDENGKTYKKFPPKSISVPYKNFAEAGGINIIAVPEGAYTFQIGVSDGVDTIYTRKPFNIYKKRILVRRRLLPEYLPYAKFINYIAMPKELDMYNALSDSGKLVFLERFWAKRDPTPQTPKNEYLEEFIKRIKYADAHFSYMDILGRETTMGRIYIKFGSPDEIVSRIHEISVKPYEIWKYYSGNGIVFVFSDFSYSGRYEIIYSNISSEPYDPNWKNYILPEDARGLPARR